MAHNMGRLFYGRRGAFAQAVAYAVKALPAKKSVYDKMPLAERAYEIAKGKDKERAFLAAIIMAAPKEKISELVGLLSTHKIPNPQKIASEVMALEELDRAYITDKNELRVYEQKLMKNEISVATLIARIVALNTGEEIEPARLLYVYSPLGMCIERNIGNMLREKAIKRLWPGVFAKTKQIIAERQHDIIKVKEMVDGLVGQIAGRDADCRIKNPCSAAAKLQIKGNLNDLVGGRVVLENIRKAVRVAEEIVTFLRQRRIEVKVDDHYKKPTKTGYASYHINFSLAGLPAEIQVSDIHTRRWIKEQAPHSLYKSYGVLSMGLSRKLSNYL